MEERVFDLDAVMQRLANDRGLFADLVRFYFEDRPALIERAREGYREGDCEKMMRAAHSLKGLTANFNAQRASQAAAAVEELGLAGELARGGGALGHLEYELSRLDEALAPYRPPSEAD